VTGKLDTEDAEARAAAVAAARWRVEPGMTLGLGSGRAVLALADALAGRWQGESPVRVVAASSLTEARVRAAGLELIELDSDTTLDLAIDGADEVDPQLNLLKGGGAALLREKVLAAASDRLLIVVESNKLVPRLGTTRGVPLEVLPFAAAACVRHLARLGGRPQLRRAPDGSPLVTDNGNWLIDCAFSSARLSDPAALDRDLRSIPGLLETGLFWSFKPTVLAGEADGAVRILRA
jgi:ribose 5-phosphate isomerase A